MSSDSPHRPQSPGFPRNENLRRRKECREDRYHALFEASSEPIVLVNTRGIIEECNRSARTLVAAEPAPGKRAFHLLRFVSPDSQDAAKREISYFCSTDDPAAARSAEISLLGRDGEVPADATVQRFYERGAHTGYIITLRDLREVREEEASLRRNLETYKALLREIHHRIKNNLSLIISLINLRSADFTDQGTAALLEELKNRIMSISLLHEKLYRGDSFTSVYLPDYLRSLAEHVLSTLNHEATVPLSISYDLQEAECPHDAAVPVGLILTELLTNAVKYAFPEGRSRGTVTLSLTRSGGYLQLEVADDGQGMPEGFSPAESGSLGYKLIEALLQQINGELHISTGEGTAVRITFPNTKL